MVVYRIHMGKAKCAVDLGNGSERGEYVDQDYILAKMGRPHRSISLMYCYYPLDEGWPGRASVVHASPDVSFAWDYPYDDYFTYKGGLGGSTDGEPFNYMREIRQHGQDVSLTLTIDPHVSDEHLAAIGEDLKSFGRVFLRINHEATGNWFSFNKRCTYQEVADFFVRASRIIKEHAPNVQTIICIGGIEDLSKEEMEKEAEFAQTIPAADIWSVDKYMALHWGWPYDVAEHGGTTHSRGTVADTYEKTKRSFERFRYLNGGVEKPMTMAEFNADGDVTGPYEQADMVKEFCDTLEREQADLFNTSRWNSITRMTITNPVKNNTMKNPRTRFGSIFLPCSHPSFGVTARLNVQPPNSNVYVTGFVKSSFEKDNLSRSSESGETVLVRQ